MDSNNQIESCLSRKSSEGKPQIFTTLRNIDLNLLTIFEAVYVHKGIVNAAKVLNLTLGNQSVYTETARYIP